MQEHPQPIQLEFAEGHLRCQAAQFQLQHGRGLGAAQRGGGGERPSLHARSADLNRPDRDRIRGAETARFPLDRIGLQARIGRQLVAGGELSLAAVEHELHHRHARNRTLVVRVQHAQHRIRDLGEVVFQLVAGAGVEIRKGLDQAGDVRIFAGVAREPQPTGDLGMSLGKLGSHFADEGQLAIVVRKQFLAHAKAPAAVGGCDRSTADARL